MTRLFTHAGAQSPALTGTPCLVKCPGRDTGTGSRAEKFSLQEVVLGLKVPCSWQLWAFSLPTCAQLPKDFLSSPLTAWSIGISASKLPALAQVPDLGTGVAMALALSPHSAQSAWTENFAGKGNAWLTLWFPTSRGWCPCCILQ